MQRRERVVALALRWWARVAVVVEERFLVNSRRDGQIFVYRYFVGRHGDHDAVADDGARPRDAPPPPRVAQRRAEAVAVAVPGIAVAVAVAPERPVVVWIEAEGHGPEERVRAAAAPVERREQVPGPHQFVELADASS